MGCRRTQAKHRTQPNPNLCLWLLKLVRSIFCLLKTDFKELGFFFLFILVLDPWVGGWWLSTTPARAEHPYGCRGDPLTWLPKGRSALPAPSSLPAHTHLCCHAPHWGAPRNPPGSSARRGECTRSCMRPPCRRFPKHLTTHTES